MDETRRTGSRDDLPIRSDGAGGRMPAVGATSLRGRADPATGHRQRIPTLRQLAALVVDGMLTLPRNYRRGMFLDVIV